MPVAVAQTLTQVFTIGTSNGVDSGAGVELTYDETANTGAINCIQYGTGYQVLSINCNGLNINANNGSNVASYGSGVFGFAVPVSITGTSFANANLKFLNTNNGINSTALYVGQRYFGTGDSRFTIALDPNSTGSDLIYISQSGVTLFGNLIEPMVDNTYSCGAAAHRWSTVYAGTGTINTSDAREKTTVTPLTDAELAAAKAFAVEIGTFQFLDAIALKGASVARLHTGFTVQRAIEIMQAQGLDPMRYGFICYDQWGADGDQAAGDRYSFRFDELLLFIARGFDARLTALEAKP